MALKLILISALFGLTLGQFEDLETVKAFSEFKTKFARSYSSSEEPFRFSVFSKEFAEIKKFNSQKHSYSQGINKYSDWTEAEKSRLNGVNHTEVEKYLMTADLNLEFPLEDPEVKQSADSFDWRDKKAVSAVKDQGQCGSCWAFSANGALESQRSIKGKNPQPVVGFSEQQLVDCSDEECQGGFMSTAYDYIKKAGGCNTDTDYPYQGKRVSCRFNTQKLKQSVTGYTWFQRNDENAVKSAVANKGPVAAVVLVLNSFYKYKPTANSDNIYYDSECENSKNKGKYNHGVLIVGFGKTGDKQFWIVKNSWGANWGDKGYIKMAMNRGNNCCISCVTLLPTIP